MRLPDSTVNNVLGAPRVFMRSAVSPLITTLNEGIGIMKRIRIYALVAALAAFAAPAAYAQGGGGGQGGRGARQMEMLMQGITLTDVQKASVDSISQSFRAQTPPRSPR
jgi:Spy/CpxP family protein refolding chaperone